MPPVDHPHATAAGGFRPIRPARTRLTHRRPGPARPRRWERHRGQDGQQGLLLEVQVRQQLARHPVQLRAEPPRVGGRHAGQQHGQLVLDPLDGAVFGAQSLDRPGKVRVPQGQRGQYLRVLPGVVEPQGLEGQAVLPDP
jgi:hypothetical protein